MSKIKTRKSQMTDQEDRTLKQCCAVLESHLTTMMETFTPDYVVSALGSLFGTGLHAALTQGNLTGHQVSSLIQDVALVAFSGATPPEVQ